MSDPSPRVQEFVKHYRARFNAYADSNSSLGYDSALVLVDAIKRAGSTDHAKIRDALAATKDFEAVTGSITIDENRNASKKAVIIRVHNGKFEFVEAIAPSDL